MISYCVHFFSKLNELQDELVSIGFVIQTTNRKMTEVELDIESLEKRKEVLREDIMKTERENASLIEIKLTRVLIIHNYIFVLTNIILAKILNSK